jgi:hypothetical protein
MIEALAREGEQGNRRLLRACRKRPPDRAAEQRDELAPLHWVASSAPASILSGTLRPSP